MLFMFGFSVTENLQALRRIPVSRQFVSRITMFLTLAQPVFGHFHLTVAR